MENPRSPVVQPFMIRFMKPIDRNFSSNPWHRVSGNHEQVHIRQDSAWNVPEPELALWISSEGTIEGYAIGNDMSSRDIEGETRSICPRQKCMTEVCLGTLFVYSGWSIESRNPDSDDDRKTAASCFSGETTLDQIKRSFIDLVGYLKPLNGFS